MIWALARAQDPESFSPYARELAQWLVSVALFDREIHIRRAASAAFQEHVGRMVHLDVLVSGKLRGKFMQCVSGAVPTWYRRP